MRICQGKQHTLMGETRATCLPACVSYTLTSPWLLPAQMYSPLLVAEKPQALCQACARAASWHLCMRHDQINRSVITTCKNGQIACRGTSPCCPFSSSKVCPHCLPLLKHAMRGAGLILIWRTHPPSCIDCRKLCRTACSRDSQLLGRSGSCSNMGQWRPEGVLVKAVAGGVRGTFQDASWRRLEVSQTSMRPSRDLVARRPPARKRMQSMASQCCAPTLRRQLLRSHICPSILHLTIVSCLAPRMRTLRGLFHIHGQHCKALQTMHAA